MFRSRRLYANIFIFGSFFLLPFMPWYVPFLAAVITAWYFDYYEIIFLGFLMDMAFASPHMLFTLISAAVLIVLQLIKKRVRFYA